MKTIFKHTASRLCRFLLPVLALAPLASCSDFLDLKPQNEITLDKFWNEKSDVDNVVTGCYSSMQSYDFVGRMMCWGEFRSDNLIGGTNVDNVTSLANIFKENINASNDYTSWDAFYNVINTCNTVLHYAPIVASKDPNYTSSLLNATRAEVSALRDLCYFYLIRTFRDVPYYTTPYLDDTQDMKLPASKFDAVLDSLIENLESVQAYAVKTYPENKKHYQHGRITQDVIHAMLCDMYLWKQDYANAVRYADMVINAKLDEYKKKQNSGSGSSSVLDPLQDGYPLTPDKISSGYGNAYDELFGDGDANESIFELMYDDDNNMLSNTAVSKYYGNATTLPGLVKPADNIASDMTLDNPKVFLSKNDARYWESIKSAGSNQYAVAKYVYEYIVVNTANDGNSAVYSNPHPESHCPANWIIYRLTDVMLMKAEALVQMVDSTSESPEAKASRDSLLKEAFSIVKAVNNRYNTASNKNTLKYDDYSSKALMENLVMDERERELMFEGKRWFDLVRRSRRDGNTDYLVSKVMQKSSTYASTIQSKLSRMDAIYWPYNKEELKVNPNLKQNPAFSSGEEDSYHKTN